MLTIGLLYKLQKIHDTGESWYNAPDVFVQDDDHEKNLLAVFGFYWHLLLEVSGVIRSSEIDHSTEESQVCTLKVSINCPALLNAMSCLELLLKVSIKRTGQSQFFYR